MDATWIEAYQRFGGKVSKKGEAEHCMLPDLEITYYPKIDQTLISDHRSNGLHRTDFLCFLLVTYLY